MTHPNGSFLFELNIDCLPNILQIQDKISSPRYFETYYPHFFRPPNPITRFPDWIRTSHLEKVTLGVVLRSLYGLPPNAMTWAAFDALHEIMNNCHIEQEGKITFFTHDTRYVLPRRIIQWAWDANIHGSPPLTPIPEEMIPITESFIVDPLFNSRRLFFDFPKIIHFRDQLTSYYALSVEELAVKLVQTGTLSKYKEERLLYECIPDVRAYLEAHLPSDHPIALALTERAKIDLPTGYSLLLEVIKKTLYLR